MSTEFEFHEPDRIKRFEAAREFASVRDENYVEYSQRYENEYEVPLLSLRLDEKVRPFAATVNWCRLCVESLANRMSIAGFITSIDRDRPVNADTGVPEGESIDEKLWDWWQSAHMDKEARLAHTEALLHGIAYVIINFPDDADRPEFILATSRNMHATYDPRTREVQEAYQWYSTDEYEDEAEANRGTIYTKDQIIPLRRDDAHGDWEIDTDNVEDHNLGIVPVAPLVNRAKIGDRYGRSEIADIVPLSDFASRLMTNAQMALEFLALPVRYATGVKAEDFTDVNGNPVPAWKNFMSTFFATASETADLGQLPGADLRNFTEVFNMLAKQVSSVSGLPPHALGMTTSNPASAEAIRSGESNLVMRIIDRSSSFEQGWELAMRIALIWEGDERARDMRIETTWANPETPTYSSKADAVVKLRQARIIPNEQAQSDLGYSPEQIRKNEQLLREEAASQFGFDWESIDGPGGVNGNNGVPPAANAAGQSPPSPNPSVDPGPARGAYQ